MTPEEITTLRAIGLDLVQGFVAISNETLLLTIYGAVMLKASFVLLGRGRWRQRSSLLTMLALLFMFTISIILWCMDMANFIMEMKLSFISDPDLPLDARFDNALNFIFPLIAAIDALYSYMSLVGDGIIIWRVWNLKSYYRPWVILIPLALLLGSLVSTLMLTYCVATVGSDIVVGTFQKPPFCKNVQIATYATAFATTTVATTLIALTTWSFRSAIRPMLSNAVVTSRGTTRQRRSPVENVLLLLVESGVLYFLFFAVQFVGAIPRVHNWIETKTGVSFAFTMYSYCSSVLVGLYPTTIVVLAHMKSGILDDAAATGIPSTLRMAAPTHSGSSGTWPTLQLGSKPTENEIELNPGLHHDSSTHDAFTPNAKPEESHHV
ncbi:hypothetical protein C8F04DRAFT_1103865 [Mycena alexandri]|uniref:Uncharacterized protein n=1 Tax=Mycena alexandri TaxID=1745969 RepID=A0AAD6SV74_9AGAR|nr:hypothetical protein C8F04DRAFT_1103865 [Mycena alexandri]